MKIQSVRLKISCDFMKIWNSNLEKVMAPLWNRSCRLGLSAFSIIKLDYASTVQQGPLERTILMSDVNLVFFFENCSDLLGEKIDRENFWNSGQFSHSLGMDFFCKWEPLEMTIIRNDTWSFPQYSIHTISITNNTMGTSKEIPSDKVHTIYHCLLLSKRIVSFSDQKGKYRLPLRFKT